MKRRKLSFISILLSSVFLTSCNGPKWLSWLPWIEYEEEKCDFEISTDFSFYKDAKKKEKFDTNTFDINTKIFVFVDFTITKYIDSEETISFEVKIPYAEYYSTKDFRLGTIKPSEEEFFEQDSNGNLYTVKLLTRMNFLYRSDDKFTHPYTYIFEIEANQECESADFITLFTPENNSVSVAVNGQKKKNKAKTSYTFVKKLENKYEKR